MDCVSRVLAFLLTVFFIETIHAALTSTITTNAGRGSNGVTIPTTPTTPKSCDDLTFLHNVASSKCNLHPPRELVAVNYNDETKSWHVLAAGAKIIVKAFIEEKETVIVIPAVSWHEFLISSSSRSLAINFTAPTRKTTIPFPTPFDVSLNNTNITIAIREVGSGKTLNIQKATITLFGILAAKNCSATNCLDAVSNWLTAADAMKRCKNDSNYLRYRYKECFEPPEIISPPRKQRVKFGTRVTMVCRAKVPVIQNFNYTWYKDDKPLTGGNGGSLVIPSAKLQDQGSYKCKVSTRYKSVVSKAAELMLTDMQAKTVLVLSVSRNKNEAIEPQKIANSIQSYLNSAQSKWEFDVQFKKIRHSSTASVTVELIVYSVIGLDEVNSYYSQEQQLIEKGAKKNSFEGFTLRKRKVQMESTDYCLAETNGRTNLKGLFLWPLTAVGKKANLPCPYGPTGAQAQRSCTGSLQSRAKWTVSDDSNCTFQSKTTEGLKKLSKRKISKGNANEVVKQTKRLTQGVAEEEINTADIAFVADIIDRVLNAGAISSTEQDLVDIINSVMAANATVLADGQKSNGTASKFVRLIDAIAEHIPIVPGESTRTLVAPNLVIQAAESDGSNFAGRSFASRTTKRDEKDQLSKDAISSRELPAEQTQTGISLPSSIKEKFHVATGRSIRIVFAVYQNAKFFQTVVDDGEAENGEDVSQNWTINSRVISGAVAGMTLRDLSEPVVTTFQPIKSSDLHPACVFWNFSANGGFGNWSSKGCRLVGKSSGRITCHCNHLTNFAVLFSADGPQSPVNADVSHTLALSFISYIGCGISLLGVMLTLLTYAMFRTLRKSASQHILMSLCIALALLLVVFIIGANRLGGLPGCRVVAALLHYLVLVVVLWMGVEGYHLYLNVVQVLATYQKSFMLKASIVVWGVPAIIVGITLATSTSSYGDENYCVLTGIPFYGGLFAPALLIIVANFIVFFCVMCKLARETQSEPGKIKEVKPSNIRSRWRTGVAIMVLLGLTWFFGALAIGRAKLVFEYLFCIFNSLQGLFIFIFYCVMRSEVRKKWREYYQFKKTGNYTLSDTKAHATNGSTPLRRMRGKSNNSETNLLPSTLTRCKPSEESVL